MRYVVTSDRFDRPRGTVLTVHELGGCNIAAAVFAGHLAPAPTIRSRKTETPDGAEEQ